MNNRLAIVSCILLACLMTASASANGAEKRFSFEGCWASNFDLDYTTMKSDFLSIQKYDDSRYIVISYSTNNQKLNFIAGGRLGSDGILHVETEDHIKWAITRGDFFDGRDYISLCPETNIINDDVASYCRIQIKLKKWPF
jgi:hypothetical protein